ncbi:MAG: enoyl-CoA hydratase/isomerase family protein [Gammaproteobacteria bacterium]
MSEFVHTQLAQCTGIITLDRPKALNSLSLGMVRDLTRALLNWREDPAVDAVVIKGGSPKAFCAGGDIRFFHDAGRGGSAQIEDFFTEEYALNHLVHNYPKPYIALMDGVVMGGGMGIAQAGPQARLRVVTDGTRMAMPEVNIGLFPDVGGSYFLSRTPGKLGLYLALTGLTIGAADALAAGLADVYLPPAGVAELETLVGATPGAGLPDAIRALGMDPGASELAQQRERIDRHFGAPSVAAIMASLESDADAFAQKALAAMRLRSPLMMCVTHALLARGATFGIGDCLRMERNLVRRTFEHGEVLEGVRALVIDKDQAPGWNPARLEDVSVAMVEHFFEPVWPDYAHPLRMLA